MGKNGVKMGQRNVFIVSFVEFFILKFKKKTKIYDQKI